MVPRNNNFYSRIAGGYSWYSRASGLVRVPILVRYPFVRGPSSVWCPLVRYPLVRGPSLVWYLSAGSQFSAVEIACHGLVLQSSIVSHSIEIVRGPT